MSVYAPAADVYDLLQSAEKDYAAEALVVANLIGERRPDAARILDVACGTGQHAAHLHSPGFAVDGIDLEPAFIELARRRCPDGVFTVADMTAFTLPRRYDAITCLFSAIGYALSVARLNQTLAAMTRHLAPGGVVIVDPWFEPGQLTDRSVAAMSAASESLAACRVSRTLVEGSISRLELTYCIGRATGVETRQELHELGLFTQAEVENAFRATGLSVERRLGVLRRRGVYIGRLATAV
jgi:SAM-dependent methyltransferase